MKSRRCDALTWLLFSAAVALSWMAAVQAQSYPVRPVRLIVPFPPGATADTAARTVAQKLGERLGQQVVVDNRGGASTIIGTEIVAKALPDGYTLISAPFNFAVNPSLFRKLPYDPARDFRTVALLGMTPIVLVVHPSVPSRSVRELIALARANPGKLNYASAGEGSSNHLAAELFNDLARVRMTHVPYKGAAPAVTALVGGETALMFSALPSAISQIKAGRLKALAVASRVRASALPAVPTMAEAGVANCEVGAWHGVLAPSGTPNEIVTRLNAEIVNVLRLPEVAERFSAIGFDPAGGTPEDFGRFIRSEMERWAKVVKAAKISIGYAR